MKNTTKRWLSVLLCLTMICAVGCTPTDDTTVTTTTQEITTTTTVTDTTTTVEDATTTTENVTTTTEKKVTTTDKATTTTKKVTTTTKKVTTTVAPTTTKAATTTKPVPKDPLVITCYGDSVTDGIPMAMKDRYPSQLQGLLGDGYKVQNAGDSGEKTPAIMARQGALKIYTKSNIRFMQGQSRAQIAEGVSRGVLTEEGDDPHWCLPFGRDETMVKNATIDGVKYQFDFVNWDGWNCETWLVRNDTSKAITIPKGTEVVLEIAQVSKTNYCDIYLMGFNGTYSSTEDLIAQYQKMIDHRGNDRYLIIIPFFDQRDDARKAAIQAFKDEFGDHAIDFLAYVTNEANVEKVGVAMNNGDRLQMRRGEIPYNFKLYGSQKQYDVHLNEKGLKLLAHAVYEHGKKLNLW